MLVILLSMLYIPFTGSIEKVLNVKCNRREYGRDFAFVDIKEEYLFFSPCLEQCIYFYS